MPGKASSTAATGGKGYTFADKAAAGLLVQMLARIFPLDAALGLISELHFETKESGRSLDDLHLLLQTGGSVSRWSISVKSNRQLTGKGFNCTFVMDVWAEWRSERGANFDQDSGLLGLVTGTVADGPLQDWDSLRKEAASTTPDRFVQRIDAAKLDRAQQISSKKRRIFASLYPVEHPDQTQREATARLAGRVHVLHFNEKKDEGRYINQCANLISSGTIEEGTKLWNALCQLAADNRGTGGYFDVPKLLRHLRGTFDLVDYPDFKADWKRLDALTADNLANVRSVLGDNILLDRSIEAASIFKNVEGHAVTVVAGESGSGKSALVRQLAQKPGRFGHVIWLSSTQLSKSSQNEISTSNGLRHALPDLIASSSRSASLLVIDALEKFEGEALLRIGELLRAVRDSNFTGWKVVISGHLQSWEKAQRVLLELGVTDFVRAELEPPSLSTIRSAVQALPGIGALFFRTELQPILRNLMVLDWVLRTNVGQGLSEDPRRHIGETDLINSIWDHWISRNRRLERDRLLRKLGEHEGEKLSGAVSVDSVDQTELQLLDDMSREDLVRIELPSVRFTHDLIGDWARFHMLAGQANGAIAKIKSLIQIPRWNRAVRLYAQSLVEGKEDLADWHKAIAELDAADAEAKLAKDLFLEALVFAANSVSLLEAVWPNLIADKGKLLSRLMDRLLLVATFPDPRFRTVVPEGDADLSESWFRIPMPVYWIPVLLVFSAHANDIAKVALAKGAEVCALYLRNMPVEMPARRQAAHLALVLARELQDRVAAWPYSGSGGKVVYEAMLLGAGEDPDSVVQVALEIAGRRPEPDHAVERRKREQVEAAEREKRWRKEHPEEDQRQRISARALPGVSYSPRQRRAPIPDGPQKRIPEGFRHAVMDWGALSEIMAHRPQAAKEILLAVCLEDPGHEEQGGIFHSFGLEHWQNGYPPIYFKGPFLTFLQRSPQAGLETIVKLSNIVSEQWMRVAGISRLGTAEREQFALKFKVGEKAVLWFGNGHVYNLHRDGGLEENTIACALMAVEKWLYDEVDAGHEIHNYVQYIFDNATSLAFAGVLISVGLYHPALFHGCLRPLLGNIHIYDCQSSAALNESFKGWSIGFAGRPQQEVQLAISWNGMPHRRVLLRDLVPKLLFENADTQAYLKESAAKWEKTQKPGTEDEREKLQLFLAKFRPESYELTSRQDDLIEIRAVLPEEVEQKRQVSQAESEFRLLSHGLALHARRTLNGQEALSADQLPEFFHRIQVLQHPEYSDLSQSETRYRLQSIAGGLAVLFINHRSWLSQNKDSEQWCFDVLRNLRDVDLDEHEGPESGDAGYNVETFLGEIGVFLLQERQDEWIKRIAFEGVTGFYYASTLFTMWRAHVCRKRLGGTFDELVHALLLWSALRRAAIREEGYHSQRAALPKYRGTLYARFLNGKLGRRLVTIEMAAKLGGHLIERIERKDPSAIARRQWERQREALDRKDRDRKANRDMAHIDYQVLQAGFSFLSAELTSESSDRRRAEGYIRQLFNLEMETLPILEGDDEGREIGGTAYEFDIWVMQQTAELLATFNSPEQARPFCEQVLRRGPAARYWTQDFLEAWITVTLPKIADRSIFVEIWKGMVDYTFSLPAWIGRRPGIWYQAEGLSVDLMGLREPAVKVLGRKEYVDLVKEMAPTFKRWGDQWLKYASVATWFANFLTTESGRSLLAQGIQQLSPLISSFADSDWERDSLAPTLTAALAAAWKHMPSEIAGDPPLRNAFLHILTELCARSVAEAVHLRDRVSQIITIS
jgi:hypothetical protein